MAENLKYEQINWGWLNDYSGYKFAPITFFENIYTSQGNTFEEIYSKNIFDLETGIFVVGSAKTLIEDKGTYLTPFTTNATTPVYFNEGIPVQCEKIEIDLIGNINNIDEYSDYTLKSGTILSDNITSTNLESTDISASNIHGDILTSNNITTTTFEGDSIVTNDITANDITTTSITSDTFQGGDVRGEAIYGSALSGTIISGSNLTADTEVSTPKVTAPSSTLNLVIKDGSGLRITSNNIHSLDTAGQLGSSGSAKIYGAVWNDYAEFRNQIENIEPGYCVASFDNGQVQKTTEKLQACDGIVSDTYGFAIGDTDVCRTPIAVAGRVLAYCEGNRMDYHAGDTVCASANGKVCKMTREEIREYPDRIVGVVSEIPQYEIWNNGIEVKGRIWVNVK